MNAKPAKTATDALQIALFKVDADVCVSGFNITAGHLLVSCADKVLNERLGDALQCVHSLNSAKGCGFGSGCSICNVRNSVQECLSHGSVVRKRAELDLKSRTQSIRHKFMITVKPYAPESDSEFAALIVEDLHAAFANEKLPIRIDSNKIVSDNRYHDIINDHLIKYRTVTF
jgi:hypothetical protein